MQTESVHCRWLRRSGGNLAFLLGLTFVLGWLFGIEAILSPNDQIYPMQFSSAAMFAILGILFLKFRKLSIFSLRFSTGVVLILTLVLIAAIYSGIRPNIANLLSAPSSRDIEVSRMNMGPSLKAAISFFLVSLALFMSSWKNLRYIVALSSTLASAAAVFGFIDFFAFLQNFESVYGWTNQARMPLTTSLGFIVLGGSLASYLWEDSKDWEVGIPIWTSVIVLMAGLAVTAMSYNAAVTEETHKVKELTLSAANHYQDILNRSLGSTGKAVRRMARRWKIQKNNIAEWNDDVGNFLIDVPQFEAIGVANAEGKVSRVKLREGLPYNDLKEVEEIVEDMRRSEEKKNQMDFHLTETFFIRNHMKVFAYIAPVTAKKDSDFLFAILNVHTMFSVNADKDILPDFNFRVTDDDTGDEVYVRKSDQSLIDYFTEVRSIHINDQDWTLRVSPTPDFLTSRKMAIVGQILAVGISVSCLVALLVLLIQLAQISRRQVQKTANRLQAIVNGSTRISIIATDLEGVITNFNPGAEYMLGYQAEDLVGKKSALIFHLQSELAEHIRYLSHTHGREFRPFEGLTEEARHGKFEEKNWTYIRKDGTTLPVNLIVTPIYTEDEISGFLEIAIDVTRSERQLREYSRQLEIAYRELEQFSYIASHDLKEPMRNLISYSKLLEDDLGPDLPPDAADDLTFIKQAATRMGRLVDDLLNLSRAGRSEIKKSFIAMQDILDEAKQSIKRQLEDSRAKVQMPTEMPKLYVDENLFVQLFVNLISNSIKFVEEGVVPHVVIESEVLEDKVLIRFRDNGIGIQEKYLKQIFAPFKRLHGMNKYEGTGIGLSICQKIVERHDGRIWVESSPHAGSTFYIEIPYEEERVHL